MRHVITIALIFINCVSSQAQISSDQEYRVDASQRQTSPSAIQPSTSFSLNDGVLSDNLVVVVNRQMYKSALLTRLMPYIQNNKYKVSLDVVTDPAELAKYSVDKRFEKLLLIKMPRRLARKLRKENRDFRFN